MTNPHETLLSRREALRLIGGALATTAALGLSTGCSPEKPTPDPQKERLKGILSNLPESPIKHALIDTLFPYFQTPPPQTVTLEGVTMPLSGVEIIRQTYDQKLTGGVYTAYGRRSTEKLYPLQYTEIKFPYLYLIRPDEEHLIPSRLRAADGTPLMTVTYPTDISLAEGFHPAIQIVAPRPENIRPEEREEQAVNEEYLYLKEACTMFLDIQYKKDVIRIMRQLGLPLYIGVRKPDGKRAQAEIVNQSFVSLLSNTNTKTREPGGRLVAAIDLGGYALAHKAATGTTMNDPRFFDSPTQLAIVREIERINFGESPSVHLQAALQWALRLSLEELSQFHYNGDLSITP